MLICWSSISASACHMSPQCPNARPNRHCHLRKVGNSISLHSEVGSYTGYQGHRSSNSKALSQSIFLNIRNILSHFPSVKTFCFTDQWNVRALRAHPQNFGSNLNVMEQGSPVCSIGQVWWQHIFWDEDGTCRYNESYLRPFLNVCLIIPYS